MAKRIIRQVMTPQDWLSLSNDEAIKSRMASDPYSMAYPALVTHFSNLSLIDWDAAVLGLHIVYGWMPTIPKLGSIMQWDTIKQQQLVGILSKARAGNMPDDIELELLKSFCNNSIIGASKLIHFLNPKAYPIWDSRVAKVFLNHPKAAGKQVNAIAPWKNYRSVLLEWLDDDEISAKCNELRSLACFFKGVCDLRLVESVLFHKTESKRKQGKN